MIIQLFRISLFVMLAALSAQAMALSGSGKSDSHDSNHCAMLASGDMRNTQQISHHSSVNAPVMADHMLSGNAEHSGCCEQDCSCPANLCGHAFFVDAQAQQTITPDTRKHIAGLHFMRPSLITGALFRPPIIA
ncbi:hypothetical protein HHX48_03160 [Salinimonas sp. HHU 13199]|uniref:CopL family metal-binding regulatory protein n=1 Tax=Salinimonas profundi TaxID=2729140 RepID=A0ABR8LEM6_9ALTE|nr:hypothetical protein [Salinimonas profundi]MBD3584733.1 hypothetical protein [Salinimonas profundi]